MSPRSRILAGIVVATLLAGCGTTVDLADTADTTAGDTTTSGAPGSGSAAGGLAVVLDVDAAVADLLPVMLGAWQGLDQRVIDRDGDRDRLDVIEAVWRQAEPQLRRERPSILFGFEQAIDLARSAVDRRRPADASKGYKLASDLTEQYLADG